MVRRMRKVVACDGRLLRRSFVVIIIVRRRRRQNGIIGNLKRRTRRLVLDTQSNCQLDQTAIPVVGRAAFAQAARLLLQLALDRDLRAPKQIPRAADARRAVWPHLIDLQPQPTGAALGAAQRGICAQRHSATNRATAWKNVWQPESATRHWSSGSTVQKTRSQVAQTECVANHSSGYMCGPQFAPSASCIRSAARCERRRAVRRLPSRPSCARRLSATIAITIRPIIVDCVRDLASLEEKCRQR
jgi:hypothetical protein